MTASREDLSLRLEAAADLVGVIRDGITEGDLTAEGRRDLVVVLTELVGALKSEAGLALGRPSLVNRHLVRMADVVAPPGCLG